MSEEHMATAREVTRDWTPQTTLADSRRDIANALAAAEERGRRSGVEEAADLYEELAGTSDEARHIGMRLHGLAPLVPRDSGKVEVCRAEVASRMPDYSHYECTLPKGHSGAHREGGAEWTDKDTVIA